MVGPEHETGDRVHPPRPGTEAVLGLPGMLGAQCVCNERGKRHGPPALPRLGLHELQAPHALARKQYMGGVLHRRYPARCLPPLWAIEDEGIHELASGRRRDRYPEPR
jgi:hypothetical protein